MTKYEELIEVYQNTIDRIKSEQARLAQLNYEIKELEAAHSCYEHADYTAIADLVEEASELSEIIAEGRADLDYEIKREYELVPYAKTRNQGISGFYRLAELDPQYAKP